MKRIVALCMSIALIITLLGCAKWDFAKSKKEMVSLENSYNDYETLLLQIDTDDELGLMWGDCGVANFFIRSDDLERLDFTKVLYNWDCC